MKGIKTAQGKWLKSARGDGFTPVSFITVFTVFCLITSSSNAMELALKDDHQYAYLNINPYVSFYEDFSNEETIETMLSTNHWTKNSRGNVLNFGFVKHSVWIRFPANLIPNTDSMWHLLIPYPLLENADLFMIDKTNTTVWHQSLEQTNRKKTNLNTHQINFALPNAYPDNATLYLKVRSSTSLQVPLELWEHHHLVQQQNLETLLWGLYFGLIGALILYNSFLFISMRDTTYIYYVFTLVSIMVLMLSISGFGNRYLWDDREIGIASLPIAASSASFWLLCFCIAFLKSENIRPLIRALIQTLALVTVFVCVYVIYVPQLGAIASGWIGTLTITLVLTAGITSLLSGQVIAKFFVLATASFGLGGILYLANVFGLLPSSRITNHSIQVGSILEALLFSFALAHRIKEERQQKLIAMEKMELAQRTIVQVQNQALQQALHDPVSKKPNEFLFTNRVNELISKHSDIDTFALVLMSFPQIKQIASSMGRRLSEEVFESVINSLEEKLEAEVQSIVIEYATNSFVAVEDFGSLVFACKTGESYQSINDFVGYLLNQFNSAINVAETSIQLDAFCGISVYPRHGDRADLLLQHASAARDYGIRTSERLSVYSSEIDTFGRRRLALIGALSQAVKDKELKIYLQPQFDCVTQQLAGAEVLLRWNSHQFGAVSPDEFIEVAEEAGLMGGITRYLINESFAILNELKSGGMPFKMSINLSTQNLTETNFVPDVVSMAEVHKINLQDIVFEVTETYMSEDFDSVIKTLDQLGSAGCCISLDDYGTGYSSLMYLSQLPINELKIDRSFVSQTERSENDYRIVENTVKLARALQIETVAEGVENKQTFDSLVQLGCNRVQGFYFAKPMPASQFRQWLKRYLPIKQAH
ncbi:MAG: EAL domain-containing protein [Pseudomonadales bacterium]|nr:EAL domain-containing protein [Pseudomonadales bacterium]